MRYEVLEISLADLDRLYKYCIDGVFGAELGIKGFDYPWLLTSCNWKKDLRVLGVGCAYSPMPAYLQKTYGCEIWVADDFGMNVEDNFWKRGRSPQEFIKENPQVNYVLERLGNPDESSLPVGSFDIIYSLSVLEHVPYQFMPSVWKHMDKLLNPGGLMLHALDLTFPSNGGFKKMVLGLLFDHLSPFIPVNFQQRHVQATPLTYLRHVARLLDFHLPRTRGLDVFNMSLSPNVLVENYQYGLNRIIKDGMSDFHFERFGSLMIRLRKQV